MLGKPNLTTLSLAILDPLILLKNVVPRAPCFSGRFSVLLFVSFTGVCGANTTDLLIGDSPGLKKRADYGVPLAQSCLSVRVGVNGTVLRSSICSGCFSGEDA